MKISLHRRSILITAGPTVEAIDPVRYLSNHASGKLGYTLAKTAARYGAQVDLVSGPTSLAPPPGVRLIPVLSAREMYAASCAAARKADIIIMTAAVADYRPIRIQRHKLKKSAPPAPITLELIPNPDILANMCKNRRSGQYIVGFSLESGQLVKRSRAKLRRKGCDLLVANPSVCLGKERQQVTLFTADGRIQQWPELTKRRLSTRLLTFIASEINRS